MTTWLESDLARWFQLYHYFFKKFIGQLGGVWPQVDWHFWSFVLIPCNLFCKKNLITKKKSVSKKFNLKKLGLLKKIDIKKNNNNNNRIHHLGSLKGWLVHHLVDLVDHSPSPGAALSGGLFGPKLCVIIYGTYDLMGHNYSLSTSSPLVGFPSMTTKAASPLYTGISQIYNDEWIVF